MEDTMMMVLQFCETMAGKDGALSKQEKLTYDQALTTLQKYLKTCELSYDHLIEKGI